MIDKSFQLNIFVILVFIVQLFSCAHREKPIVFRDEVDRSSERKWGYPLKKNSFEVTSGYGDVRRSRGRVYYHQGVDIKAEKDEYVYAVLDGKVLFAGRQGGYGKIVILSHSRGWETRYAHLNSILVKTNQRVKRGEKIGRVGMSGNATGYHLHFEVRRNGVPQNPIFIVSFPR
ncbi:MAG: M23 family metallopeptidase [Candidatus Hydrogenedentes bacterium]|nr:M23 family metallopeptidase [Candidatus Hydrogenedentota bacterium]